jgi:hypothetical protein
MKPAGKAREMALIAAVSCVGFLLVVLAVLLLFSSPQGGQKPLVPQPAPPGPIASPPAFEISEDPDGFPGTGIRGFDPERLKIEPARPREHALGDILRRLMRELSSASRTAGPFERVYDRTFNLSPTASFRFGIYTFRKELIEKARNRGSGGR